MAYGNFAPIWFEGWLGAGTGARASRSTTAELFWNTIRFSLLQNFKKKAAGTRLKRLVFLRESAGRYPFSFPMTELDPGNFPPPPPKIFLANFKLFADCSKRPENLMIYAHSTTRDGRICGFLTLGFKLTCLTVRNTRTTIKPLSEIFGISGTGY